MESQESHFREFIDEKQVREVQISPLPLPHLKLQIPPKKRWH